MNASSPEAPNRNLAMELIRVAESAALATGQWVGCGQKEKGDGTTVGAMRQLIDTATINGVVVIDEGEKGEAPMLFSDEKVGNGQGPAVDITVDPIDDTTLMAEDRPNSIAALAATDRGFTCDPSAVFYIDKIAVDPGATGEIDTEAPVKHSIKVVAKTKGLRPEDVTVVVLDRSRHADMICDIREANAEVRLIGDGDVAGAAAAAQNTSSVDVIIGIGDAPGGVITAYAMKCTGSEIQGKLHPRDEAEIKKALDAGHDLSRVLTTGDLVVSGNCYFAATGVIDGNILRGVAYRDNDTWTRSLVICSKSSIIHRIEAFHSLEKLRRYAGIDYGRGEMPNIDL